MILFSGLNEVLIFLPILVRPNSISGFQALILNNYFLNNNFRNVIISNILVNLAG